MNKQEFRNLLCLLHSIDGDELPKEWSYKMKSAFLQNSLDFFLRCDEERSDAIWHAMMNRLTPPAPVIVDDTPF